MNLALAEVGQAVVVQIPEIVPKVINAHSRIFSKAEFDELCRVLRKLIGA